MKKSLLTAAALLVAFGAGAEITVNFPKDAASEYSYQVWPVSGDGEGATETLKVTDGKAVIADPAVPSRVAISLGGRKSFNIFAAPGEKINVDIQSLDPVTFTAKGTELMEGVADLSSLMMPIQQEFVALAQAEQRDEAAMQAVEDKYDAALKKWMADNSRSTAMVYALMSLDGQDFIDAFNALTPEAKASIIYPFAEENLARVEKAMAAERKMQEMQSGNYDAPAFTFKNLEGKDVSLSDFRGKWVVIDFWGSWCPWCIKGFPKLKEAYKEYAGKLEVIGVDCNDPEQAWRDAVKKYELPWVNVYNPEPRGGKTVTDYAITGFPTKVVVNPEGKIANITVGEDPSFFDTLAKLINGK